MIRFRKIFSLMLTATLCFTTLSADRGRDNGSRKSFERKGGWKGKKDSGRRYESKKNYYKKKDHSNIQINLDFWSDRGRKSRKHFIDNRSSKHLFDHHFWSDYSKRKHRWKFDNKMDWWVVLSLPAINSWLSYGNVRPRYYYYDDRGVVYYSYNSRYDDMVPVSSNDLFISQAVQILDSMPYIDADRAEWMPLGVFADTGDVNGDGEPDEYYTLAITKEGVIGGIYVNSIKDETKSIEGYVDPKSQRAVFRFVGSAWPVFETGIYNLSQDETTAFVYKPNGRVESRLLVRMRDRL